MLTPLAEHTGNRRQGKQIGSGDIRRAGRKQIDRPGSFHVDADDCVLERRSSLDQIGETVPRGDRSDENPGQLLTGEVGIDNQHPVAAEGGSKSSIGDCSGLACGDEGGGDDDRPERRGPGTRPVPLHRDRCRHKAERLRGHAARRLDGGKIGREALFEEVGHIRDERAAQRSLGLGPRAEPALAPRQRECDGGSDDGAEQETGQHHHADAGRLGRLGGIGEDDPARGQLGINLALIPYQLQIGEPLA